MLVLTGDLTDLGKPKEAEILAEDLRALLGAGGRRPRQPRLRMRPCRRGARRSSATPACSCSTASPARSRASASSASRASSAASAGACSAPSASRRSSSHGPGEHERGDAARERHAQRALGALGRRAALRADPGDDRGRAARDLPVPRLLAPRRDDRPLQGHRRWCTATPIAASTRAGRPAGRRSTTSPARSRSRPGVPTRSSRSDALASPAAAAYMGRKARTGHPWPAFP